MIIPENLAIHKPKDELLKIINNKKFNDKILFETESNFHNITVTVNEIGRFIHYNDTYQAGIINTSYYKGNLPYINYFFLPYFYKNKIDNVLLIGLGTGQIVNDLFKLFPEIKRFDICDIEENILNLADKFYGFNLNDNSNFYLQDALVFLKSINKKYDLIIVDVANNDGIDERFLSEEYVDLIKNHLKKTGLFISNLCSSADLEHRKNTIYKYIIKLYSKNFADFKVFKGDYSDKIYYKAFFDIDERVIDITNLIIISSLSNFNYLKDFKSKISNFKKIFPNIDIDAIIKDEVI